MSKEKLDNFIDMILDQNSVQPHTIFFKWLWRSERHDVQFSFLVSRCIIRYAPKYTDDGAYLFSNPGHAIIKDKTKGTDLWKSFSNSMVAIDNASFYLIL